MDFNVASDKKYTTLSANNAGQIFDASWYQDLVQSLLEGKKVEEFIEEKDKKLLQQIEQYDERLNNIKDSENYSDDTREFYLKERHQQIADALQIENENIREFVAENKEKILAPSIITAQEVKEKGLSQDYVDGMILSSKYPREAYRSIRQFYEELKEPAAPRMAYNRGEKIKPEDMVAKLREKGLDAVLHTDERAKNPDVFVVTDDSIHAPFLEPRDALKANIMMVEATNDLGGTSALANPLTRESMVQTTKDAFTEKMGRTKKQLDIYHRALGNNPETVNQFIQKNDVINLWHEQKTSYQHLLKVAEMIKDNPELINKIRETIKNESALLDLNNSDNREILAYNVLIKHKNELQGCLFEETRNNMIEYAIEHSISPKDLEDKVTKDIKDKGYPESVFHGGQHGDKPYSVLCGEKAGNMCFIYGAVKPLNAVGYAMGASSHHGKENSVNGHSFGFLYEYEARKEKQELLSIDNVEDDGYYKGGTFDQEKSMSYHGDETPVFPHQNKLKKIYLVIRCPSEQGCEDRIFPLELDENGKIKDEKWREFVELHNPIDDNLSGNMVEHRNNMIAEYDTKGKENMYRKINAINDVLHQGYEPKVKTSSHSSNPDEVKVEEPKAKTLGNEDSSKLHETLKEQTEAANQAKNASAQTPSANGDLHSSLKNQKANSGLGSRVSAISNGLDDALEKIGNKVNDNAVGRTIGKIDSWRPNNKIAAKAVDKVGVVPVAAVVASGVSAYEQYKSGDKKGAAATMVKGTAHAVVQGVATSGGMNLAAKGVAKGTEKVVTKVVERNLTKKTVEKVADKAVVKAGAKAAGKAAGKAILKKVPFVSLAAGAYFAYERAKNGEWGKAVGELCSGAAGCVPGLGTAISTGIDCGLAVADTKQAINETKKQQAAEQTKKEQTQKPQQNKVSAQRLAELRNTKPGQSQKKPAPAKKQQQKPIEKGVWDKFTDLFSR